MKFNTAARCLSLSMLSISLVPTVGWSAEPAQAAPTATPKQRYVVSLRSPALTREIHQALQVAQKSARRDPLGGALELRPTLLNTSAQIVTALSALDMIVVEATAQDADKLRAQPDVAAVEAEQFFPAPRMPLASRTASDAVNEANQALTVGKSLRSRASLASGQVDSASEEFTWGVRAVHAAEAWQHAGRGSQGQGARVAIIDTGIDRDHVDLGGRIEAAQNFVTVRPGPTPLNVTALWGSMLNALGAHVSLSTLTPAPPPPYDYFDQVGHGTHVAGTIAANLDGHGVVGVAPSAKILMGRVCGRLGCSSVAILNGINWAIEQKVDVLSMSLGGPISSPAQEEALRRSFQANVVNVAASGNDGHLGVSFPAGNDDSTLAVGAVDVKGNKAEFSNWGPQLDIMAPGVNVLSSVPMGSGRASKVQVSVSGVLTDVASSSFIGSLESSTPVEGELVDVGLGKPEDFARVNVTGKIALILRGEIPFADKVKNALAAQVKGVLVYNNGEGLISGALTQDGSSLGIPVSMVEKTVGEELKAQLIAGQHPVTAIATLRTDYAAFQGTSMACPHAAGVAALVRAANPGLNPTQVFEILKRTAKASANDNSANQYGAGMIDADAAVIAAGAI